ncbi:hypothetical protein GCM10022207_78130 [Streptomyces lannensis]|uniref:Transposase n=1 Tax=Streptomyces lannensis TaxID=766498 RepID=A0ABP7LF32_9ACTN
MCTATRRRTQTSQKATVATQRFTPAQRAASRCIPHERTIRALKGFLAVATRYEKQAYALHGTGYAASDPRPADRKA